MLNLELNNKSFSFHSMEDNVSLISEASNESVDNQLPQRHYVDRGTNTEDTFRLVPFEIDHWASKCSKFADEFQNSRSFEDAQMNISELEESLDEYLKFRYSDEETLRVDILLYVILANIIDGLDANSHIYTNEVPSVSKILTKCLLTSGQLGRYGFQSFKQSMKAIRFLIDFYKNRKLEPQKVPIVLWQSVKKVGEKGTTPYPILYPAEFRFHLDVCPDTESCKTVRLDFGTISTTPIVLRHCTSTLEIVEALKCLPNQNLDFGCDHIQPKLELRNAPSSSIDQQRSTKLADIGLQQMIICDIDLGLSSDKLLISDIVQGQPQYSKSFQQFQVNCSGSVVIRFKSRYFESVTADRANFYILGTKQYYEKHSQILLVDVKNKNVELCDSDQHWLVADLQGKKVQDAEKIEDIKGFKWDLKFGSCKAGCWTNSEIHFVDSLTLLPLLEDCSISFEDHVCPTDTNLRPKCPDCKLVDGLTIISVDQVFDSGSVQINVKLDLKRLGLVNTDGTSIGSVKTGKFALFKFALSIPLEIRGLLMELQKESTLRNKREVPVGIFNQEDFKEITKLWEDHKDYYYAVWYAS